MSSDLFSQHRAGPPSDGRHLASIGHAGRFWDVYVEFADDPRYRDTFRALLSFSPADRNEGEAAVRTAVILIESSYEEALTRARAFEEHQLVALLRSCLPD